MFKMQISETFAVLSWKHDPKWMWLVKQKMDSAVNFVLGDTIPIPTFLNW